LPTPHRRLHKRKIFDCFGGLTTHQFNYKSLTHQRGTFQRIKKSAFLTKSAKMTLETMTSTGSLIRSATLSFSMSLEVKWRDSARASTWRTLTYHLYRPTSQTALDVAMHIEKKYFCMRSRLLWGLLWVFISCKLNFSVASLIFHLKIPHRAPAEDCRFRRFPCCKPVVMLFVKFKLQFIWCNKNWYLTQVIDSGQLDPFELLWHWPSGQLPPHT